MHNYIRHPEKLLLKESYDRTLTLTNIKMYKTTTPKTM